MLSNPQPGDMKSSLHVEINQSIHKRGLLCHSIPLSVNLPAFSLFFLPPSIGVGPFQPHQQLQVQWEHLDFLKCFWEVGDVFSSGYNLEGFAPLLNFGAKEKQDSLYVAFSLVNSKAKSVYPATRDFGRVLYFCQETLTNN